MESVPEHGLLRARLFGNEPQSRARSKPIELTRVISFPHQPSANTHHRSAETTMPQDDTRTTTPRLRFPEFREDGGWEEKSLSELSTIVRGGSPRPIDAFITSRSDGLNWLKIGDVSKESKYIVSTEQKVIREALSKTREIAPGDFILSNSMSFGRPYISRITTCIHDGWIAVTEIAKLVIL